MGEALAGNEFFVPRSPAFSANAPRSDFRPKGLSKSKFNGGGGTQTYLSFHAFAVPSFSEHQSAGDVQ
jgi:hypothetical protein